MSKPKSNRKGSGLMAFAERIQALRKARGLSQEQLAEKLNISRQAISKWESGQSSPDTGKIIALSDYFGVTTDYLLLEGDIKENTVQPMMQVKMSTAENKKSRRFTVGIIFLCSGIFITLGIIITAAISVPSTGAWLTSYPSKLWFLIFEGKGMFPDSPKGLGLGLFFLSGIAITVIGFVLLIWEYLSCAKKDVEKSSNITESSENR